MKKRLKQETLIEILKTLPRSKVTYAKDFNFKKEYYLSIAKEYEDPKRMQKT
jgi:hypothetical protein